jgi:hypothetical protein
MSIPKIPKKNCDGGIGSDGIPIHFKKGYKNYGRYEDLLCVVQHPKLKFCSIIGPFEKEIRYPLIYEQKHSKKFIIDNLKIGLYAAKHGLFVLQFYKKTNKISFKNNKIKLNDTYIPSNLIVFYKQNINYAIIKFLMYDARYNIEMPKSIFCYVDGLTYGYSDENIKGWYLHHELNKIGAEKYGEEKWFGDDGKIWMKNITKPFFFPIFFSSYFI